MPGPSAWLHARLPTRRFLDHIACLQADTVAIQPRHSSATVHEERPIDSQQFTMGSSQSVCGAERAELRHLHAGANPAIVVGNAQPTLMDWLVMQPQNDRIVYTTAEIARGILEGISRHGLY